MIVHPDVTITRAAPSVDAALINDLRALDLPTFGHILEHGMTRGLTHIAGEPGLTVGRVITVQLVNTDSRLVHYVAGLIEPGDFVVISNGPNAEHASVGGGVAAAFAHAGAVGVAVDGKVTDVVELRDSGLAVFARGLAPFTTRIQDRPIEGSINQPVSVGGVVAIPGSIAMADENGLLIASQATLAGLTERVRSMMAWEVGMLARVRGGGSFAKELIGDEAFAALERVADTKEH